MVSFFPSSIWGGGQEAGYRGAESHFVPFEQQVVAGGEGGGEGVVKFRLGCQNGG